MKTFYVIIFVGIFAICNPLHAQFQLPKLTYDTVEVIDNSEEIVQKRFFDKKNLVLEINYPNRLSGSMQGLCHRSNIVDDSIYIYYGKQRREIAFRKDVIYTSSWNEGTLLVHHESYYPTGQLWSKYTQVAVLDPMQPLAPCTYDHFFVGEYLEYDKEGKITLKKDYSTGKQSVPSAEPPAELGKLYQLKKTADEAVSWAFGKSFFQKNIAINFDKSGYHRKREKYDDRVPSHNSCTNWFFYPDQEIEFVDFVYNIKVSDTDYYPTIIIRLDRSGNIVKDIIEEYREKTNSTIGLVAKPISNILSKEAAVGLAMKEGLPGSEVPLVELIWEPDQPGSSNGSYYYRLLFDKLSRSGPGFVNVYFREWLVNVTTKQVTKDREYVTGEATVEEAGINKDQQDGKYGFVNRSEDKILIPYEYDELPYRYDALMIARKGGKMGAINFENEIRVPFIFDRVYFINAGKLKRYENQYLVVEKDEVKGLYDADGHELFPTVFSKIEKGENEQIVGYKNDKIAAILDLSTNKVTEK